MAVTRQGPSRWSTHQGSTFLSHLQADLAERHPSITVYIEPRPGQGPLTDEDTAVRQTLHTCTRYMQGEAIGMDDN